MTPYNIKVITYDTGEQDIVTYSSPIQGKKKEDPSADPINGNIPESPPPTPQEMIDKAKHSLHTSRSRTIQTVYDYARANQWEYFLTFTFDPKKVDRYDYDKVVKKMSQWLKNVKKRQAPNMKYLVVPELHQDGAVHFHALISDIGTLEMIDSGHKSKGLIIYNIPGYKFGWTTATKIKDTLRASNYITKYITKDLSAQTGGKKRFWTSTNLKTGLVTKELLEAESLVLIEQAYQADSKRHKKVEIATNDFHQTINYYTV